MSGKWLDFHSLFYILWHFCCFLWSLSFLSQAFYEIILWQLKIHFQMIIFKLIVTSRWVMKGLSNKYRTLLKKVYGIIRGVKIFIFFMLPGRRKYMMYEFLTLQWKSREIYVILEKTIYAPWVSICQGVEDKDCCLWQSLHGLLTHLPYPCIYL